MGKEEIHSPSEYGREDEKKGVKRDARRQNAEEMRHLSGVSRIDKTVT